MITARFAFALALASTLSTTFVTGCLFGEVRGIPCEVDDVCPETYFCDVPRAECREVTDVFGPPDITIPTVLDRSGEEVRTPFMPPGEGSIITLLPVNSGLSTAEDLRASFGVLECFTFDVDEATLPAAIEPGERGAIEVVMTPALGCEGLTIIDWFITFSGRETRGVFDVNVKRDE